MDQKLQSSLSILAPFCTAQEFAQDFLEDKLTPFYKSDPVPESVSQEK
jgi:hypothetical protein